MENSSLIASLLPILYNIVLIILCVVDQIRIASFLMLFSLSTYPLVVGLIYQYSYPEKIIMGSTSPLILYTIGAVLTAFTVASLLPAIENKKKKNFEPNLTRWGLLIGALISNWAGLFGTLASWFAPGTIGLEESNAALGIYIYLGSIFVTSILMYLASRKNSESRPNLMRKVTLLILNFSICPITLILALIIIYAFPSSPPTSYPTVASYTFTANIILGATILLIARDSFKKIRS